MTVVAGVDGCRSGWIMVRRDGRRAPTAHIAARWVDLPPADMIAVDMPIGLPDRGRRGCDFEARALLGRKRSSVFIGLRRPLLSCRSYSDANAWGKSDDCGLAKQAWYLLPKIKEIDDAMTPLRQAVVRESHPELAFCRLAGAPVMERKSSAEGERRRIEILRSAGMDVAALLSRLDRKLARNDDLVDAAVLCIVAGRMAFGTACRVPSEEPPCDARGLRMEIWY